MIQRKNFEAAYNIMAKIYAHATPDQVDLKVRFCAQCLPQFQN